MSARTTHGTAAPAATPTILDRNAAVTRSLLGWGVVVGPFYLTLGILQGVLRDGFSFARHPLSVLANGPGGWVQTANFVLSGAMVIAAAIGFARVLRPHSRMTSWFLGAFGAGMLAAAAFPADPVDGFPPGTPLGMPATISTPGLLHFTFATLAFVALAVSCFTAARALSRRGERGPARYSLASGLVVLVAFFGGSAFAMTPAGVTGIWLSVVVGWLWLAMLSRHLHRISPDPRC